MRRHWPGIARQSDYVSSGRQCAACLVFPAPAVPPQRMSGL